MFGGFWGNQIDNVRQFWKISPTNTVDVGLVLYNDSWVRWVQSCKWPKKTDYGVVFGNQFFVDLFHPTLVFHDDPNTLWGDVWTP